MLQREKLLQKTRRKEQDRFGCCNSTRVYDEERVQAVFQVPRFFFQASNTTQRCPPHAQCGKLRAIFRALADANDLEHLFGPVFAGSNGRSKDARRSLCQIGSGLLETEWRAFRVHYGETVFWFGEKAHVKVLSRRHICGRRGRDQTRAGIFH